MTGLAVRPWLQLLALAVMAAGLAAGVNSCAPAPGPSLLLITIDTLRADHLGAYGYGRDTSPTIDGLAARGLLFENVVAAIPETGPSFASLLTGQWPAELGMRGNGRPLPDRFPTLSTLLGSAGYRTAAFVSGYPLTRKLSGLQRGFDHYDDEMPDSRGATPRVQRLAPGTTDAALAWLAAHGDEPFFLWVHYYDVHGDYAPGPPYDEMFQPASPAGPRLPPEAIPAYQRRAGSSAAGEYVARYDGEIRKVDDQVARLLAALAEGGHAASTVVAVTADHGESLTEHGYFFDHGNELYRPSLQVPLILAGPGLPGDGRRVAGAARLPDLMPTLLELLGQPVPAGLAGASLRPWWASSEPRATGRESLSEARFQPYRALTPGADVGPKLAVRDERYTFILRLDGPRAELYDRLADPLETRNVLAGAATDPGLAALAAELSAGVRQRLARRGGGLPETTVFTPAVRARLDRITAAAAD